MIGLVLIMATASAPAAAPVNGANDVDIAPEPDPNAAPAAASDSTSSQEEADGKASPNGFHRGAGDSTYGRIDGDVSLVFGVGVTFAPRAPLGTIDFRARYLQSLGIYVDYADGFGDAAEPKRLLSGGFEVRPLFLGRWLQGFETGHSRWDLTLDSLGITLGAVFEQPAGRTFASRPGLELALGVEVPITGRATGLWLDARAGARWSDTELGGAATSPEASPDDRSLFCTLTLAWHQGFSAHVVDEGDRAPR